MTNTLTMDTLYKKLNNFGIPKKYIKKNGLPSWWDDELNDTPVAVLECSSYIEQYGFDFIQEKIYPFRDCDNNLKFIFGYSEKATEDRVKEDLIKEIKKLKQETGYILYPYPN